MKILRLLLAILFLPLAPAGAQEVEPPDGTTISTAHVSGFDLKRLSPALQEAIATLAGTGLNRRQLTDLAARIEAEQPEYVAGVRASRDPDGAARVVFVVARLRDQERAANINSRYVVEAVRIRGVPEADLSPTLRDDLHALAGRPLDSEEADRLEALLQAALPDHEVRRRTVRGSQPGQITLIFDARIADWARWLRFVPQDANLIYHSDQGWGARMPLTISSDDLLISPIFAIDIGDELVEEYGGFGVRVETRRLGTERLGALFEWSSFDQTWRDATLDALAADASIPAPYRNRMTVMPMLRFAITRQLSVGGGVRVTELDPLADSGDTRMANAVVGSLSFAPGVRNVRAGETADARHRHHVSADFVVRAGTGALESDLVYERYVGQARYSYRRAQHAVQVSGVAGRIDGDAPLFERFSLGDSRTLRGWNKYDLAPAGGDRMLHASVEYRYRGLGMFVDGGSVWDHGTDRRVRFSAGITARPGPVFVTLGFPLNTDEFGAVLTMGVRFSLSAAVY